MHSCTFKSSVNDLGVYGFRLELKVFCTTERVKYGWGSQCKLLTACDTSVNCVSALSQHMDHSLPKVTLVC